MSEITQIPPIVPPPVRRGPGRPRRPPGRPTEALMARVRYATRDGQDLVDLLLKVMRGSIRGTVKDRIDAAKYLWDRGYGKALETTLTLEADARQLPRYAEISSETLLTLAQALRP